MTTLKTLLASLYSAGIEAETLRQKHTEDGRTADVIEQTCIDIQACATRVDDEIRVLCRHGQEV